MQIDLSSDFVRFTLEPNEEIQALCSSQYLLPYMKAKLSVYAEAAVTALLGAASEAGTQQMRENSIRMAAKVELMREICDEIARMQTRGAERTEESADQNQSDSASTPG